MAKTKKVNKNYSEEVEFLLDCIEIVLPIGEEDWSRVLESHNGTYPERKRDVLSIRRKFQKLYRKTGGTGNPTCHKNVREARRIRNLIIEKADAGNLTSESEEGEDSDKEDTITYNENEQNVSTENSSNVIFPIGPSLPLKKLESVKSGKKYPKKKRNHDDVEDDDAVGKVMAMMMMQRQSDKEDRKADMKAEMKLRREEKKQELNMQRIEMQFQQQQSMMMNMMMMSMFQGRPTALQNSSAVPPPVSLISPPPMPTRAAPSPFPSMMPVNLNGGQEESSSSDSEDSDTEPEKNNFTTI